jgi:glutathionylspermidine amidase/synthetase
MLHYAAFGNQSILFMLYSQNSLGKIAHKLHTDAPIRDLSLHAKTTMNEANKSLPFGAVMGITTGNVLAYSSDYDTVNSELMPDRHAFRHYHDGVYTGYKWQCVEFARRWLLINKGYVFEDIAMAYDIFSLTAVKRVADNQALPLKSFLNGALRPPEQGCMIIWQEGGDFEVTGHVAVVTDVLEDGVCIAEQNASHHAWQAGSNYSRKLPLKRNARGEYWLSCEEYDSKILGWVVQTDDSRHAFEIVDTDPQLLAVQKQTLLSLQAPDSPWLDTTQPDEAAYLRMMQGHKLASDSKDQLTYFSISATAEKELKRATNELHALFMHATDHVLQNPDLLQQFNIPQLLWPRICQSWNNRRNQMLTGRFDFCMSPKGIKLFEYNADSASCYMECGKIQGKWATHFGCEQGHDSGASLFDELVDGWQEAEVGDVLHIMYDKDLEETYHALYMQGAITKAGIPNKLIKGLSQLQWNENGQVVDAEGVVIKWVWKTWAWETALDQLREELSDTGANEQTAAPCLKDVLLHPEIMVFEPLWTLIASNKAILPILWQLFPEHPNLLETSYNLSPSLQHKGYVSKPIAGRCGLNISLIDKHDNLLEETEGRFAAQQVVYQQLSRLPLLDDYYVQLCTFSVAGSYAGSCVRVDHSPIIKSISDLMPLRVLNDDEFLG